MVGCDGDAADFNSARAGAEKWNIAAVIGGRVNGGAGAVGSSSLGRGGGDVLMSLYWG